MMHIPHTHKSSTRPPPLEEQSAFRESCAESSCPGCLGKFPLHRPERGSQDLGERKEHYPFTGLKYVAFAWWSRNVFNQKLVVQCPIYIVVLIFLIGDLQSTVHGLHGYNTPSHTTHIYVYPTNLQRIFSVLACIVLLETSPFRKDLPNKEGHMKIV